MTTLAELKKLAEESGPEWFDADQLYALGFMDGDAEFCAAANPATILKMIELIELQHRALDDYEYTSSSVGEEALAAYEEFNK